MDFFSNQDSARRNTRYLVFLFLLALLVLVCLANGLIMICIWIWFIYDQPDKYILPGSFFSWQMFWQVGLAVTGLVGCAIVYKWMSLSDGGKVVAESLGGRRVLPGTKDIGELRLLNVVEEMALASGMPVPSVYLLNQEKGINAFAAGNSPADAVIGITRGALEQFNREQLQGVIAHEFSHILNGDMRLNMRLLTLLHGILFFGMVGRVIFRTGSRFGLRGRRSSGAGLWVVALGAVLMFIGWSGTFMGGMIKAAINRQREFLADASAVQFTRNPAGIADALKIIGGYKGGSRVRVATAMEVSHLFIGNALADLLSFDSHPSLAKRIKKIERNWDGRMIHRKVFHGDQEKEIKVAQKKRREVGAAAAVVLAGTLLGEDAGRGDSAGLVSDEPSKMLNNLDEPLSAMTVIYALLLDKEQKLRTGQIDIIKSRGAMGAAGLTLNLWSEVRNMDPVWRIILIEKAMPALRCMSHEQYKKFKKMILALIMEDRKVELFEWCLYQLVCHYLGAEFGEEKTGDPRYRTISDIGDEYALVLSIMVHNGHLEPETARRAFNRGASSAGLYNGALLPESQCTVKSFTKAVNKLIYTHPMLKKRLLVGLANSAKLDGTISVVEKELITAIAAVLDSPIPRFAG